MINRFDLSPGQDYRAQNDTTLLDTSKSLDKFLLLYLNQVAQTFNSDDYYNYYDINRVEEVTQIVKDYFTSLGYDTSNISTIITSWSKTLYPYKSDINRIEGNINELKNISFTPIGWEAPKLDWQAVYNTFGYIEANRIEQNLYRLYLMLSNIELNLLYCGAPNTICGNDSTIL